MSLLDAVRRPEYTGENRCLPCTVVNAVVVVAVAALSVVLWPPAALVVLLGGGALIALRGYVVPYTPQFAPRLVAPLPVEFKTDGGSKPSDSDDLGSDVDGEDVLYVLFQSGIVCELADGGITLADDVRDDWEREIEALRTRTPDAIADAVADAAPFEAEGRYELGGFTVEGSDRSVWLTRPIAVADAAAVRTLTDRGIDRDVAAAAAVPLRMFVEVCPVCGGRVVETTAKACCGGTSGIYDTPETPVLACEDCDAAIHEFDE